MQAAPAMRAGAAFSFARLACGACPIAHDGRRQHENSE
jgi:hypothetical protein